MKIVVVAILVALTSQQCTTGCLACSSTNTCTVCDVSKKYYANNGTCAISALTNCAVISQAGACVSCNTGYYLDASTAKCVSVPTANIVANCAAYSGSIACVGCNSGFFISGAACVAVTTTVANCGVYSGNGVCVSCNTGFLFSFNNTNCVAVPTAANCGRYTYAGCNFCNSGFVFNRNLYYLAYGGANVASVPNWVIATAWTGAHVALSVCQAVTVSNCLVYTSFSVCQTCATGFYLSGDACVANPAPYILNCATYSSLTTCITCIAGFYVNNNACVAITAIVGCITYNVGAVATTTCVACNSTAYVSGSPTVCALRQTTGVSNCATYTANADTCATCNSGFMLTTDGKLCLAVVPNCMTYATWSVGQTSFTCTACVNTYALNTASPPACVSGTISNCAVYSSPTACTSCANTYYLNNNVCTAHVTIPNCATYSQSVANTCVACSSGFYNFGIDQTCIAIPTVIANCATYAASADTCTACASGYYLSNNACTAIVSGSNCAAFVAGTGCSACNAGFYVNTNVDPDTCISTFDYLSVNCDSFNSQNTASFVAGTNLCVNCKAGSHPFAPNPAESICVKGDDLTAFYGTANAWTVANCVRYGLNYPTSGARTLVCQECSANNYILGYGTNKEASTARTCGACLADTTTLVILDDLLGTVNICVTPANLGYVTTNYISRIARTKYLANTNADYQITTVASTGILLATIPDTFAIEAPSATATTPLTTSSDFAQGFTTYNIAVTRPSVFFYRGLLTVAAALRPTSGTAWYTNCAIAFSMTVTGSPAKTGGNAGGAADNYWAVWTLANACLKCNDGFQLSYAVLNTPVVNPAIPIPGCVAITDCASSTVYFGGLPTYLNTIINCHSCATGKVPIVSFEHLAVATNNIRPNTFLNYRISTTFAASGLAFKCDTAPATVFKDAASAASALANCGVFGNLVALTDSGAPKTVDAPKDFCLACATGWVPTYSATATAGGATSGSYIPYYAVTACTVSANCDTSNTIPATPWNSCGRCLQTGLTANPPIYYAYADHTFSNCYKSWTPGCFILDGAALDATNANRCKVCSAGFFLNQDGYCDTIAVPNTVAQGSFVRAVYTTQYLAATVAANWDQLFVRYYYGLGFSAQQVGVTGCATNYIRAPALPAAPMLCVTSSYLTTNVAPPTDANLQKFVVGCTKYSAGTGNALNAAAPFYKCVTCTSGKIPNADQTSCVTSVSNCQIAQNSPNSALCEICATNFWNVNGNCVQTAITNCKTLVNTQTTKTQALACTACNDGFYKTAAGACTQGTIANCRTYTDAQVAGCTACLPNFALITIPGSLYCYPIPTTLGCTVITTQNNQPRGIAQGYVSCGACIYTAAAPTKLAIWNAVTNAAVAQTMCLPFVAISNCNTYDQTSTTITSNSFRCTACATGFFISNSGATCAARTVNPTGCATFVADQDKCATCNAGFFLNTLGTLCVAFPIGVPNCLIFFSPTNCTTCATGFYPNSSGVCTTSTIVTNCLYYSANYTCSRCNNGYWLQNTTTCTAATAQNCLTYTSASACATCSFGFSLATAGGVTSCNAIVVANCAMLSATNQLICGTCNTGFFLNAQNVCTAVTTAVANCLYYSSATLCANCTSGFVLSADKLSCSNAANTYIDANCGSSFLNAAATCAQCSPGYFLGTSGCTACPLFNTGCAICDATNSTACLLCQNTHYMNQAGSCVIIPPPINNTPVTPASANLWSVWSSLVLILALVRRN
jgi:hypothetical protein